MEIAIVLVIVLMVFGPKRVPELGRTFGRGIREFRGSIGGEQPEAPVAAAPAPAATDAAPAEKAETRA